MKNFLSASRAAGVLLCYYGLLCLPTAARTTGAEARDGVPSAAAAHRLDRRESGLIPSLSQTFRAQWEERKIQISRFLTGRHQSEIAVYPVVNLPLRDTIPAAYRVRVKIGPERFQLDMDTGSSVTWVPDRKGTVADPMQLDPFDPSLASSSFQRDGSTFGATYGINKSDGEIAGYTGSALVSIGRSTVRQTIGIVTESSVRFAGFFAPAMVGVLGMDGGNGDGAPGKIYSSSIMRTLVSSEEKQPLFTVSLPLGRYSHINIGQIDHSRYTGQLVQTVTHPEAWGAWAVKAFAVSVGEGEPVDTSEKFSAFDTGTSGMILAEAVVRAYKGQVPGVSQETGEDQIQVPCDAKLPDLHLHLHSASGRSGVVTIPGAILLGDRIPLDPQNCWLRMHSAGPTKYQFFGLPVFNSHFFVFDFRAGISCAPHAQ
ncbi:MAG: hypothetical protein M1826_003040 [Phylliscum demangeonii]|nr:MAG: hypothetical protein M1826_003040 [Phylliscum demangeonii]